MSPRKARSYSRAVITFPIPMRGNESREGPDISRAVITFPIPMRGNEFRPPPGFRLGRHFLQVSNPHEG